MKIKKIEFRKIINSGGKYAIESTVILKNNIVGVASSPSAIIPGKREVAVTDCDDLKNDVLENLKIKLYKTKNITQQKLDQILEENMDYIGSDISLSISLAFARAIACSKKIPLVNYIESLIGNSSMKHSPFPLVAIFSGGVHGINRYSIQQIMLSVNTNNFDFAVSIILEIYDKIEIYLKEQDLFYELGASSGFVVKNLSCEQQFELLTSVIENLGYNKMVSIAIDCAAEHLKNGDNYLFENKSYSPEKFYNLIQDFINKYNITFVEDPFDTDDKNNWLQFKENNKKIDIVGDDLFATQSKYIDSKIANGIIIKMNQAGTLSSTIKTIKLARKNNIKLCVSHRSFETEDTFMCDLAVASNSEYIKIGGPRRGDRIAKYNRLLDLTKNTHF